MGLITLVADLSDNDEALATITDISKATTAAHCVGVLVRSLIPGTIYVGVTAQATERTLWFEDGEGRDVEWAGECRFDIQYGQTLAYKAFARIVRVTGTFERLTGELSRLDALRNSISMGQFLLEYPLADK